MRGQCPECVAVGKPFSVLASINVAASPGSAELGLFDVPPEGQDVVLVMWAPGLHVLGDHQQTVHVPADGDSRPVRFELRADTPGPAKVSITAWIGGTHLGELRVEITAERDRAPGPHREVLAEITMQPTAGAVSLVVRYDPSQQAYRFEFRDEDNPSEVPSNLAYDPGPVVEQLIADLDSLAAGRSGYSAGQTRDYLVNAGARLWQQLVPGQLREQFWDRQHRIRQLTILADKDAVPWELLYPMDPGHDAGFLVEQFPVTRAIFGWRPGRTLRLQPARFVLPEGSLHEAAAEVEAMRRLLDPGQAPGAVISELTPLTDLIGSGTFGLLHFACHNTYEPVGGSCIRLGRVRFTPTLLEVAAIQKALQASAPTVFINACRSAGLAATYNRLDGWASKFLEAGAAAFIGSLWAVSDGASREFAEELYRRLQRGLHPRGRRDGRPAGRRPARRMTPPGLPIPCTATRGPRSAGRHDDAYGEDPVKVTDEGVPVEALISVVKDSIKRAGISRTSQDRDLQVASVQLILDVVAAKTAGGGLDFRVPFIGMKLRVGGKVTSKDTHTIDITLVPPEERATRQVRGGDVEEVLVNAIATVRAVVTEAAAGDDPWVLSASTIDIRFAITQTGTISLGVDGELANEVTQTLRLGLAPSPA